MASSWGERLRRALVHAAVAQYLFIGAHAGWRDFRVCGAVGDGCCGRPLAADQRGLVGQLLVGDRVEADEQLALVLERPGQVRSGGGRPEDRCVGLVGEHDHEHVLQRRELLGRGAGCRFGRGSLSARAAFLGARGFLRAPPELAAADDLPLAVAGVGVTAPLASEDALSPGEVASDDSGDEVGDEEAVVAVRTRGSRP